MDINERENRPCEQRSGGGRKTNQNDSRRVHPSREYEPAEILVFGKQNAVVGQSEVHKVLSTERS